MRLPGSYAAVVEHESCETFMTLLTCPTEAEANRGVKPLLEGSPTPGFDEVVLV